MNFSSKSRVFALLLLVSASLAWTASGECQLPARLFTVGANTEIHLNATKWCVELEPVNNSFQVTDIDFSTVYLYSNTYPITGDVDRIYPMNKTYIAGDRDGNGIQDVEVCFSNADLNALFSNLHGNKGYLVHLGLTGHTVQGGIWSAGIDIYVYPKS